MPVHALRKRRASFAQKDYNGILKTDSFSYTLSSVTFFQKGNPTTDAVLLLNFIVFTISASGLFLKFRKFKPRYSYDIFSHKKQGVYLCPAYFLSHYYKNNNLTEKKKILRLCFHWDNFN